MEDKPDWTEYRKAWEELLGYAQELRRFSSYLSMEQQRELDALTEQIRSLKRNRDTFAL